MDSGDENRRVTLKRRYDRVEAERDHLQELFNLIREQPDTEAYELFRRLRTSSDPLQALRLVRRAHILISSPDPTSSISSQSEIEELDREALKWSPLKLCARPWTMVAGDGIVSSLISLFFTWDGSYLTPFVDLNCFMQNMSAGNVASTEFCSPFLVNAICCISVSAHFSTRTAWRGYTMIRRLDS